jgi:lipopolysaccharide export system protein LptA
MNYLYRKSCIAFFLILLLLSSALSAPRKSDIDNRKKSVIITGERARSRLIGVFRGVKRYLTELTGNPSIISGKIKLSTNKIVIHGNGEMAECQGRVVLVDSGNGSVIRSDRAIFYKRGNRVELKGNPRVLTRRGDDNSVVQLKAKRIVYRIDDGIAHAHGNVNVRNKDLSIKSGRATYFRRDSRIEFSKEPFIMNGRDTYQAEVIRYNVDKKVITMERNVRLETHSQEKDSKSGRQKWIKAVTRGDRVEHYEDVKTTIVEGNAVVERPDSTFSGKKIEIRGKDSDLINATDVHIIYKNENIEALGKVFMYFKSRKHAVLWGEPFIIVRDKGEKERARINGDYMEFYQDVDELYISGNVVIYHESEIIRGEMARYLRKGNSMYITGNPIVEKDDSFLTADLIQFNTENYSTKLMGNIRAYNIK